MIPLAPPTRTIAPRRTRSPLAAAQRRWVLSVLPAGMLTAVLLTMVLLTALARPAGSAPDPAQPASAPDRYAGTYRIEDWRALEGRGLHHFFYLHADGRFLLAAEWPGHERSQFVGNWSVSDDRLYLNGQGDVDTNQGAWHTELYRAFRIQVDAAGFTLLPEPRKNRYGLLGWPQPFRYYRRQPVPNLPSNALPTDAAAMGAHIAALLTK